MVVGDGGGVFFGAPDYEQIRGGISDTGGRYYYPRLMPLPPDYGRIEKETGRWFGEYRYGRLVKMFHECDTAMGVDHLRCLYYGAAQRGDTTYRLTSCYERYTLSRHLYGQWNPGTQRAWWRLQMMISAVWSSGDGTAEYPFHVASRGDARFMCEDVGERSIRCSVMGETTEKFPMTGEDDTR